MTAEMAAEDPGNEATVLARVIDWLLQTLIVTSPDVALDRRSDAEALRAEEVAGQVSAGKREVAEARGSHESGSHESMMKADL